jgi:hypothetical protein
VTARADLRKLVGVKFDRLTVIRETSSHVTPNGKTFRRLLVRCTCGSETAVFVRPLLKGNSKSCGCKRADANVARGTHGDAPRHKPASEYRCWTSLIDRCENNNNPKYEDYGGRGIKVCQRWRKSYESFLADMGRKPSAAHSIDRIDNDGNYEPGNCRWATASEQNLNQRKRTK